MAATKDSITLRYRDKDTPMGVTRQTVERLREVLGVDETQVIHIALRRLAQSHLPQYDPDNGPLTAAQLRQIDKLVPQDRPRQVISHLFKS